MMCKDDLIEKLGSTVFVNRIECPANDIIIEISRTNSFAKQLFGRNRLEKVRK